MKLKTPVYLLVLALLLSSVSMIKIRPTRAVEFGADTAPDSAAVEPLNLPDDAEFAEQLLFDRVYPEQSEGIRGRPLSDPSASLAIQASPGGGPSASIPATRAVSYTVCPTGPPTRDYSTIQAAVDAANDGDVIKVAAGTYTDINNRGDLAQIVYISKSVTIRGGYTVDNWTTPDPEANPTTLDAGGQGRVLYITGNIYPHIEGLRITGGYARELGWYQPSKWGGGIYVAKAAAVITNNQVFNNVADFGGGMSLKDSDATLIGNTVTDNTANFGGGVYLSGSDATLNGNTITDNTAHEGGGVNLVYSDATLIGNTITDNTAHEGGGVNLVYSDATLIGNTITGNTANPGTPAGVGRGGGMALEYSDATLSGNTISSNIATGDFGRGGGLYLDWSDATLSGNIIISNTAHSVDPGAGGDGLGGGLFVEDSDATLVNSVIADNQANTAGSGLYIDGSSLRLLHTTIARNGGGSGDGSGVCIAHDYFLDSTAPPSTVALTNTILVGHVMGITVTAGNTVTLESTLWDGNTTDWSGGGTISRSNDITGDPAFVNPGAGDYHISPGSVAIDAGVNVGVTPLCLHDIDGDPRPASLGPDIGADEHPGTVLNICLQNPAKCPLDEDVWPGEPDAWQRTGRKWSRHSGTASGIKVIWEWSAPYSGPNPDYAHHRENHYQDYSNTPDAYPIVTGTAPAPFAWARWEPAGDNYVLHQFGGPTEEGADTIGEFDCDSGLYYPIISHDLSYVYTPMSVIRKGQCIGGGYISAYRADLWGPPLSPTRVEMCDNLATGIPAEQSPKGNAACKASPYVGVVYQRYAFGPGPTPSDKPGLGCEAIVYAWGWPEPRQAANGQDYQAWFRNGELRFSRWLNLWDQITDSIPEPDDHVWWNAQCERAWANMPNWLYTGNYKIGFTVYTDTIALPLTAAATIPISGGSLTSTLDGTLYTFAPDTFTDTVIVTHTIRFQNEFTSTDDLIGINRFYDITAIYSETGQPANPTRPYTVTIQYTDADRGPAIENSLALYSKDGSRWAKEPSSAVVTGTLVISGTSVVYADRHIIIATPDHFSLWAVLGETRRVFLPLVLKTLSLSR